MSPERNVNIRHVSEPFLSLSLAMFAAIRLA
jgi:hypothetical protein